MTILVVDDSADDLLLIRSFLQHAGHEVLTDKSMKEALKRLLNKTGASQGIDLILLDVVMPEDDGLRACRYIKSIKELKEIPIIMLSAETEPGNIQLAFTQGAVDYIRKPIIKGELLARVRLVLKLQEEMRLRHAQAERLQEVTAQLEDLQKLSGVDPLTGLLTWERFDELFCQEWVRALHEDMPITLLMFAVAEFKSFNEAYGYITGDECLHRVANAAKQSLTGRRQIVARYRGAEFIALLPELGAEEANSISDALRKNVESLELALLLHVGVATADAPATTSRLALLAQAKEALLRAKD
ncbi:MAG: GGDEF domain-containing response regulator [Nitrospiraceae bacterium]